MTSAIPRPTRFVSALLDHIAMTFIAVICSIPYFIISTFSAFKSTSTSSPDAFYSAGDLIGGSWFLGLIGFAVYFCKDGIGGRSLAKLIFKWRVVDVRTNQTVSPMRCMFRNLFIIIWPIELVVLLVTPARRIGDYVVGTRLEPYSPSQAMPRVDLSGVIASFAVAYLLLVAVAWSFNHLV